MKKLLLLTTFVALGAGNALSAGVIASSIEELKSNNGNSKLYGDFIMQNKGKTFKLISNNRKTLLNSLKSTHDSALKSKVTSLKNAKKKAAAKQLNIDVAKIVTQKDPFASWLRSINKNDKYAIHLQQIRFDLQGKAKKQNDVFIGTLNNYISELIDLDKSFISTYENLAKTYAEAKKIIDAAK